MTTQDAISKAVMRWTRSQNLADKDVAEMLAVHRSVFSRRLSGQLRWSVADIDRLVELGILEPVKAKEAA